MTADLTVTLGAVLVSVLGLPLGLTYVLVVRTPPPPGSPEFVAIGVLAMLPGFLMGAAGLWTAARG